jgi:CHAD domain-containing protein
MQVLDLNLPAAVQPGDVEAVHRSRVASRRLREALPVVPAESAAPAVRKSRKAVRGLTRLLGGVRELDVSLALLDELMEEHEDLAPAVDMVRAFVQRERQRRRGQMVRGVEELDPDRLRQRLTALAETVRHATVAERRDRLRQRLEPRVAGMASAVDAAGSLYAFDRLHRVRISIKKLRYLLELVHEVARVGTSRLVRRLKDAQDLLGRLHDLEVLAGFVRMTFGAHPSHPIQLRALLDVIERETRQRHAEYLRLVPRLLAVLEACRTNVDRRLAHHG